MDHNFKIKIIAVALAVILASGAGFSVWHKNFLGANSSQFFKADSIQPSPEVTAATASSPRAGFFLKIETYKNAKYNFSFEYPKGFSAAEFVEREATDVILIQNTETQRGFQIAISPFGGPDLITPEMILKDIPEMKINKPENTTSNGIRALEFLSDDGGASKAEIWFIRQGYLYQITAFLKDKDLIERVFNSWKF